MGNLITLAALFVAKVTDNALSTTKTILVQRSRWILAGIAVIISDFIYFWITKRVVSADSEIAILVVAFAGGVGCSLTIYNFPASDFQEGSVLKGEFTSYVSIMGTRTGYLKVNSLTEQ